MLAGDVEAAPSGVRTLTPPRGNLSRDAVLPSRYDNLSRHNREGIKFGLTLLCNLYYLGYTVFTYYEGGAWCRGILCDVSSRILALQ